MAENIVSPGVFTRENDLSFIPQGVGAIGAAIVGPTVKGPALVPTKVNNFSEYQAMFGTSFNSGSQTYEYFTSLAAEYYLRNSGALTVVRVLSGSYSHASASVASTAGTAFELHTLGDGAIMNSSGSIGTNQKLEEGSADNIRYEVSNVNDETGTFTLSIRRGDDTEDRKVYLEQFTNVSLDPNTTNYIGRAIGDQFYTVQDSTTADPFLQLTGDYPNLSRYVRVANITNTVDYLDTNGDVRVGAASQSLPTAGSGSEGGAFQGGSDGEVKANPGFFQYASGSNIQGYDPDVAYTPAFRLLKNQDEYDINLLVAPGVTLTDHSTAVSEMKTVAEDRGDVFMVVDPVKAKTTTLTTVTNAANSLVSSYAATYWPWVKVAGGRVNKNVWCPASVVVPGVLSYNDAVGFEWFAPAGLTRGGIDIAVQAERKLTKANRDVLYDGRVNPIATFPGEGVVVFGQKTLQKKATSLDRVNVRRLLINLKKFIASTSRYLIFENNTTATRNRFLATVNPYMEAVQENQGLYAFKVVMDETNNTPDIIDRNILKGDIFIQPARAAEFIVVDFNILPTGASFGD